MRLEYFQMVDRVISLADGVITVSARVPDESPVFEGHFPGYPLVPGVLMIETMAQASGWLLLGTLGFDRMPFLMNVRSAKFRHFVGPGAALEVTARLTHDGSGFAVTTGRIESEGKRIADAELTLRTMPFPNDTIAASMRARAIEIGLPQ